MKETVDEPQEWNQQNEDTENKDPNESTESANPEETEEDQPKQLTLEEWRKMEEQKRVKSTFKLRKAGEGVDSAQWKTGRVYRKSAGEEESDEEDEEDDEDDEVRSKRFVNEIKITFNDSPRRGRGGRRPRGPREAGSLAGAGTEEGAPIMPQSSRMRTSFHLSSRRQLDSMNRRLLVVLYPFLYRN